MQPQDQAPNPYAAPNPYQPGAGYGPPQSPYGQAWATPFTRLGWKTTLSCLCIGATSLGGFISVFLAPLVDPKHPNIAVAAVVGLLAVVVSILSLGAVVFFLMWIHLAATNVRALGSDMLTISPGWAVGWWFIPLASLVMPFKAMSEISRASDPEARKISTTEWSRRSSDTTLKLWWAAHLITTFISGINIIGMVGFILEHNRAPAPELTPLAVLVQLFNIVTAIFVIVAIRDIDRKQSETAALLGLDAQR